MAPAFTLAADDGAAISLKSLRGRPVVLFFYPKDDTPTCTKEACGFRDALPAFEALDAVVLGISPDSVASHAKFKRKHRLQYPLLADTDHAVAESYGVWQPKQLFGYKYMGVARTTFVIDARGRIARIFAQVKSDGHADAVARALGELGEPGTR